MKKTFYSSLTSVFKNRKLWNYYNVDFDQELPVRSKDLSDNFLRNFFKASEKGDNILTPEIPEMSESRTRHIVSAFLLGHYIYKNTILKDRIDEEICKMKPEQVNCRIDFSYLWFLTCLFHDLGYVIENKTDCDYNDFNALIEKEGALKELLGVPCFYKNIYEDYFNYRLNHHCKNDHGIVAAHLLFNSLCTIRREAKENGTGGFCWEVELEEFYNFCSWNILAHNIWFVHKDKECESEKYQKANLHQLILDKDENKIKYKINMKDNPFFFLFCLVDTIEPYKILGNISDLKKVSIEIIDKNKILISSKLKCACHNLFLDKVHSVNDWLTEATCNDECVEIELRD